MSNPLFAHKSRVIRKVFALTMEFMPQEPETCLKAWERYWPTCVSDNFPSEESVAREMLDRLLDLKRRMAARRRTQ